jgi:hypothetical protein
MEDSNDVFWNGTLRDSLTAARSEINAGGSMNSERGEGGTRHMIIPQLQHLKNGAKFAIHQDECI